MASQERVEEIIEAEPTEASDLAVVARFTIERANQLLDGTEPNRVNRAAALLEHARDLLRRSQGWRPQ